MTDTALGSANITVSTDLDVSQLLTVINNLNNKIDKLDSTISNIDKSKTKVPVLDNACVTCSAGANNFLNTNVNCARCRALICTQCRIDIYPHDFYFKGKYFYCNPCLKYK